MNNDRRPHWIKLSNLTKDIIDEIINRITERNLTEVDILLDGCDNAMAIWHDNNGDMQETAVKRVLLDDDWLALVVENVDYDEDDIRLYKYDFALGHTNCLAEILDCVIYVLDLQAE